MSKSLQASCVTLNPSKKDIQEPTLNPCSGPHWHMLALAAKAPAVLDFMTWVGGVHGPLYIIRQHSIAFYASLHVDDMG